MNSKIILFWAYLVLLQGVISFSWIDFSCSLLVLSGGMLCFFYTLNIRRFEKYPISMLMLFGYGVYYFILPPVATSIEFKTITNNLDNPNMVFIHANILYVTLILTHVLYTKIPFFQQLRFTISEKLFRPLGYFNVPSNKQLYFMGGMGLFALLFQLSFPGSSGQGVLGKFIHGFRPLVFLPYCVLLKPMLGGEIESFKKHRVSLLLYTVVIFMIAMAVNSRSLFALGAFSMLIGLIIGVALRLLPENIFKIKYVFIGVLGSAVIIGPVSDLATGMVIARSDRGDVSAIKLMSSTADIFFDKELISEYRTNTKFQLRDWDERYVDNVFLSRMANLKFTDNSLGLALSMGAEQKDYYRNIEWQKVLALVPQPVVKFLALNVNKEFVTTSSGGDFLLYAANNYGLGGFRTGSILGGGYAAFGWLYPFVIGNIVLFLFVFSDAQTSRHITTRTLTYVPIFNSLAIATFFSWLFFLTSAATGVESIAGLFEFMVRGWVQTLLIYLIGYWVSYYFLCRKSR
jgi:hypothetical protein